MRFALGFRTVGGGGQTQLQEAHSGHCSLVGTEVRGGNGVFTQVMELESSPAWLPRRGQSHFRISSLVLGDLGLRVLAMARRPSTRSRGDRRPPQQCLAGVRRNNTCVVDAQGPLLSWSMMPGLGPPQAALFPGGGCWNFLGWGLWFWGSRQWGEEEGSRGLAHTCCPRVCAVHTRPGFKPGPRTTALRLGAASTLHKGLNWKNSSLMCDFLPSSRLVLRAEGRGTEQPPLNQKMHFNL